MHVVIVNYSEYSVTQQYPQFPIHAKYFNEEKSEWMNILKYNVTNSNNDKDF